MNFVICAKLGLNIAYARNSLFRFTAGIESVKTGLSGKRSSTTFSVKARDASVSSTTSDCPSSSVASRSLQKLRFLRCQSIFDALSILPPCPAPFLREKRVARKARNIPRKKSRTATRAPSLIQYARVGYLHSC